MRGIDIPAEVMVSEHTPPLDAVKPRPLVDILEGATEYDACLPLVVKAALNRVALARDSDASWVNIVANVDDKLRLAGLGNRRHPSRNQHLRIGVNIRLNRGMAVVEGRVREHSAPITNDEEVLLLSVIEACRGPCNAVVVHNIARHLRPSFRLWTCNARRAARRGVRTRWLGPAWTFARTVFHANAGTAATSSTHVVASIALGLLIVEAIWMCGIALGPSAMATRALLEAMACAASIRRHSAAFRHGRRVPTIWLVLCALLTNGQSCATAKAQQQQPDEERTRVCNT
mmetsp:Transcript_116661/g.329985  ORF Transcript_116661/g.329985 Transcript_116661/m.329985 type:complete len:288 (-) Transcript_116661:63-926(-)